MRVRRIGRNELAVMQTLLAIYDAQREYASAERDGDALRKYASRLRSTPGKHDGLYWPTQPGDEPSPIGLSLAAAAGAAKAVRTDIMAIATSCLHGKASMRRAARSTIWCAASSSAGSA